MAMIQCSKCGADISDKAKICPYCGEKYKRGNKKLVVLISIVVIIIIAAVVGVVIVGNNNKKKKERKIYVEHYNECVQNFKDIKTGAEKGIVIGDKLAALTSSVWSDSIFKQASLDTIMYTYKDDTWQSYSQALNNMYADETVKSSIDSLKKIKQEVNQKLNDINDVPDELKEEYESAKTFVAFFNDRVDFCSKASGSLSTYRTTYESKKTAYSQALTRFSAKMPKEIEE